MISIIIPVYNVEEYIEGCIQSVLAQTYKDYEIIIVDDCGSDKSMEIVGSYETLCNENDGCRVVVLHHEKNRGLSAARNTGMTVARGEYVYFLDSDDTITPDCLEKLVNVAERTKAELTVGNIDVIGDSPEIPLLSSELPEYICGDAVLDTYMQGKWYMMAWNKLIRREFLEKNGISFVEGLVHEDNPWSFEVACTAKSMAFVHSKTYNYLVRENSLQTGKNFAKHFNAYMEIMQRIADVITTNHIEHRTSWWFERQKALFFGQTMEKGTTDQQMQMYKLIHRLLPQPSISKTGIHYLLPSFIGVMLYKKFYGYHLL